MEPKRGDDSCPLVEAPASHVVASIVLAGMLGWPVCPYPLSGRFLPTPAEGANLKVYSGANIRNVAMVGHGHAGKTTLVSAMLYTAGATPRLGRVDDGSAITDHDEEEIVRKMSISTGAAVVEWGTTKINILDTPGFSMFVHEAKMALPVVDAAIVVVASVVGVVGASPRRG